MANDTFEGRFENWDRIPLPWPTHATRRQTGESLADAVNRCPCASCAGKGWGEGVRRAGRTGRAEECREELAGLCCARPGTAVAAAAAEPRDKELGSIKRRSDSRAPRKALPGRPRQPHLAVTGRLKTWWFPLATFLLLLVSSPRSMPLRFRHSGSPQRRRLGWVHSFSKLFLLSPLTRIFLSLFP